MSQTAPEEYKTLRAHQEIALAKMQNGCILNGGVGSGKTLTSLAYYVQVVCGGALDRSTPMRTPRNLLVITPAKKRDDLDWESEALHFGIFKESEYSYGGVSITVDSWNNIKKYKDMEDIFLIADEQKVVGNGVWVQSFLKIAKRNPWILLSATPADSWIDYLPVFLANGFYRTRSEFMEQHVIWQMMGGKYRKIRGYYGEHKLRAFRDQILVEMPFERHTTRHLIEVDCAFDEAQFNRVWKRRWNVYDDVPLVDAAEMHRVGRRVVNTDPSRLDEIEFIFSKHPRLIIWYNYDYELEELRTLHTRLDVAVAEHNGHRHDPVPQTESWLYLVQYQSAAEAWNCIDTNAMVYHSLTYSHKIFEQSQGRIDRMDTPFSDLYYYILKSKAKIDTLIWRSLVAKKSFHEGRNVKFVEPPVRKISPMPMAA